jgi:polyketide cyclase/dehydrase/lipid transport protein
MMKLHWRQWALCVGLMTSACALPPSVTPEDPPLLEDAEEHRIPPGAGLSAEEHQLLRAGGRVEQFIELDRQGQRYVGGVSYTVVRAEPRQVFEVLNQLATLSQVLPGTRSTRVIDRSGNRVRVELEQGNSVVSTTFTVFFQLEEPGDRFDPQVVRFWLDRSQPHSIEDAWGFFRATRYDAQHSLVSVGALVNLGPGLIRMLFEQRIQRSILRMPNRIRETVERTFGPVPPVAVAAPPVDAQPALMAD